MVIRSNLHQINGNLPFGSEKVITRIPVYFGSEGIFWSMTERGNTYLLRQPEEEPRQFHILSGHDGRPVAMKSVEEVAAYIEADARHITAGFPNQCLELFSALSPIVVLALYPGYFTEQDPDQQRARLFDALVRGLREKYGLEAERVAAQSVRIATVISSDPGYFAYASLHMPRRVMGVLAAHGVLMRHVWKERHAEALVEGWRYQLRNPDQSYQMFHDLPRSAKAIIDLHLQPEQRNQLLAETGLSEADVLLATEVAELLPPGPQRVSEMLRQLRIRSVFKDDAEALTMADPPGNLGIEFPTA